MKIVIDLRSDTVTKPTLAMRKAMAEAEVGDDVYGEDPTILKLENLAAVLFGKEAAVFMPSGTMGNLASIMAHCWNRGQEILVGDKSHIYIHEQGSAAQLAGVHSRVLTTKHDGTFDLAEIEEKIRDHSDSHYPQTALICLENTHNMCGGAVLPVEFIEKVGKLAKNYNIPIHMDGARIMNAAVKLKVPVSSLLKHCDSVSSCLSKGLAAPVGSIVAGSSSFILRVRRCRKALGGGMRQAGILAAAGIVALTSMVDRLEEDHKHALMLAKAVNNECGELLSTDIAQVQTNMVILKFSSSLLNANQFANRLQQVTEKEMEQLKDEVYIKLSAKSPTQIRCVLHNDVSLENLNKAIEKIIFVIKEFEKY